MKMNTFHSVIAAVTLAAGLAFVSGCKPQAKSEEAGSTTNAATAAAQTKAPAENKPGKKVETIEDLADFFPKPLGKMRVSMLGGGTHHDFEQWFNVVDSVTLSYATISPVNWTTNLDYFLQGIPNHDVLYFCNNSPMGNAELNKAIFDFADKGGGFLLVHPPIWYNWNNWPEWNRVIVGGGARKHDKYGPIEVVIEKRDHLIMHNVPKSFTVEDELYHFELDPGAEIEVLATGINPATGNKFPVVWITKHPKARIVCISLGHDGSTHDNLAYRVMLQNCMAWAARADDVLAAGGVWKDMPESW